MERGRGKKGRERKSVKKFETSKHQKTRKNVFDMNTLEPVLFAQRRANVYWDRIS